MVTKVNRKEQGDRIRSVLRKLPSAKRNVADAQQALKNADIVISNGTVRGHLSQLNRAKPGTTAAKSKPNATAGTPNGAWRNKPRLGGQKKDKVMTWLSEHPHVTLRDAVGQIKAELGYKVTAKSLERAQKASSANGRRRGAIGTRVPVATEPASNPGALTFSSFDLKAAARFVQAIGGSQRAKAAVECYSDVFQTVSG